MIVVIRVFAEVVWWRREIRDSFPYGGILGRRFRGLRKGEICFQVLSNGNYKGPPAKLGNAK